MKLYLTQLIEDLHETAQKANPSGKTEEETVHDDETFLKHIEDVENYLHGGQLPISEITGILPEQLPPPRKLSESQRAQLSVELENFLAHFHFALDFPQNYPSHLRYAFIKNFWTEKHSPMRFGTSHIEFCEYEKAHCPFPGYCNTCDEFETEDEGLDMEKFKGLDENELPF